MWEKIYGVRKKPTVVVAAGIVILAAVVFGMTYLDGSVALAQEFDCVAPQTEDDASICADAYLRRLERTSTQGYFQALNVQGKKAVNPLARRLLEARRDCRTDAVCIETNLIQAIETFRKLGADTAVPRREKSLIAALFDRPAPINEPWPPTPPQVQVLPRARPAISEDLSPLFMAIAAQDREGVAQLLSRGTPADETLPAEQGGGTALMAATLVGNQDIVRLLLKHGAGREQRDTLGRTAVWIAAMTGDLDIMRDLLEGSNGDLDAQESRTGFTALQLASDREDAPMVELLLANGASPEPVNSFGESVSSMCAARDDRACALINRR